MASSSENNRRIAKNTLMLYMRMIFMMLVSLYTSRIVLNTLGVEDYGINNVVGGVIALIGFVTSSLGAAMSRFLTFGLGKGDEAALKRTFGNILTIYLLLIAGVFVFGETIGLWFMQTQLQIPDERREAAFWVYQMSVLSSMLGIFCTPYNAVIVAHERMSAFAYISIADAVLKLLIVYLLQVLPYDKLIVYSLLFFGVNVFDRIVYGVYCARNFSEVHTRPCYDKDMFKQIFSFAAWVLNGNLAVMGFTQGLNILLNMFFGPVVNAARGIAVQVQAVANQFVGNFLTAVRPQITKTYAQGDLPTMHKLLLKASKFAVFIVLSITVPLSFEADQVLHWWLGTVPEHTVVFLRAILFSTLLGCLSSPIITAVHATGDLRKFQLIEGTMLLTIVPIAYVLLKWLDAPPVSVFLVHIGVEIVTQYIRLHIVLPMIGLRKRAYFQQVILPIAMVAVTAPVVPLLLFLRLPQGVPQFFIVCLASVLSCAVFTYLFGCTPHERSLALAKCTQIKHRLMRK